MSNESFTNLRRVDKLNFSKGTLENILKLWDLSGIPVLVYENPDLESLVTVFGASKDGIPVHAVVFNPSFGRKPDYDICFDCEVLIRFFTNQPDKRFINVFSINGKEEVEKALRFPGGAASKFQLEEKDIVKFRETILDDLLSRLFKVPIGLRVSDYICAKFPDMKEFEEDSIREELAYFLGFHHDAEVIRDIPLIVSHPLGIIDAAQPLYWSEKYREPEIFQPYRLLGFVEDAQILMDLYEQTPKDPIYDDILIDKWAKQLGISDWYYWEPYNPPPQIVQSSKSTVCHANDMHMDLEVMVMFIVGDALRVIDNNC